jgi:hypothetical protein
MLHHRTRLAVGIGAFALAFAGCADVTEPERRTTVAGEASESPSPSISPSESQVSESPSPEAAGSSAPSVSAESPSMAASTAGRLSFTDRLLTAAEMPGFNEEWTWQVDETRKGEGREPFATCQKFAMTSIGASRVVVRTFESAKYPDSSTHGSQLVADFPDEMTAKRAFEVLKSWRADCEEQLSEYDRRDVNAFEEVALPAGTGGWYLLVYGPAEQGSPDESWFDAQGLTRVGKRIALLQLRAVGQDYNYPAGKEPLVAGVERAASKLG